MIDTIVALKVDTLRIASDNSNGPSIFKDYIYPIFNIFIGYVLATYATKRTEKNELKKDRLKASIKAYELLNQVDMYLFGTYSNAVFSGWEKTDEERKKVNELISEFEMWLLNNSWLIPIDEYMIFKNVLSRFEIVKINYSAIGHIVPTDQKNTKATDYAIYTKVIDKNKELIRDEIAKIEIFLRDNQK